MLNLAIVFSCFLSASLLQASHPEDTVSYYDYINCRTFVPLELPEGYECVTYPKWKNLSLDAQSKTCVFSFCNEPTLANLPFWQPTAESFNLTFPGQMFAERNLYQWSFRQSGLGFSMLTNTSLPVSGQIFEDKDFYTFNSNHVEVLGMKFQGPLESCCFRYKGVDQKAFLRCTLNQHDICLAQETEQDFFIKCASISLLPDSQANINFSQGSDLSLFDVKNVHYVEFCCIRKKMSQENEPPFSCKNIKNY